MGLFLILDLGQLDIGRWTKKSYIQCRASLTSYK